MIKCLTHSSMAMYPKQLSYDDLAYALHAASNAPDEDLKLLYQFIVEYPRLHMGSSLLTDLIQFYQWLHTELSHSTTVETARKLTLSKLKEQLQTKSCDASLKYHELYECVASMYMYMHRKIQYLLCVHYSLKKIVFHNALLIIH